MTNKDRQMNFISEENVLLDLLHDSLFSLHLSQRYPHNTHSASKVDEMQRWSYLVDIFATVTVYKIQGVQKTYTTKTSHAVDTAQRVSQCHASSFYHVSDQKVFSMFVLLLIGLV